ncbi:MAG: histidinol-phosphate transaminase [Parabacteroides sp.]|nr:histidinol-phosphate transaminase [Parabacteroides distasonis]MDY4551924.1 histidinol-phosphate transaminase [Parabacteroides sp.]
MKTLQSLVRPNIWNLQPYSSARSEFQGTATVFIDANENPWNPPYNRYPDPLQRTLKARIAEVKGVPEASIFTGNGSDEAIDLLLRIFCEPGVDNIVAIDPSYGMYQVAADINNVACRKVLLRTDFSLDVDALLAAADAQTKLIFLCSPNNPTGNSLDREEMVRLLHTFEGIVVVDEAYIDFASQPSFLPELENYPNLVVLQTLSKAWGGAALRLGMAFASPAIIGLFNKVKYPYNVNLPAQREALALLNKPEQMEAQRQKVLEERERLRQAFEAAPFQYKVYPSDANFLLVEVGRANEIYAALVEKGVIVRNRNSVSLCRGCLRITVGTVDENTLLLQALEEVGV